MENKIKAALIGMAIGDALGYPFEQMDKRQLQNQPITDLASDENIPTGVWSDLTSLAFCLADSLTNEYNIKDIANKFISWLTDNLWLSNQSLSHRYDTTTVRAIEKLLKGFSPFDSGIDEEFVDNESLRRILPLVFYLYDKPIELRWMLTKEITEITHNNIQAVMANFYFLEFLRLMLLGETPQSAYYTLQEALPVFWQRIGIDNQNIEKFWRLLYRQIWEYQDDEIQASNNAIDTLEAALWAFMRSDSFVQALLNAVNLGGDTSATGALTGGIAGLFYGYDNIPRSWIDSLALKDEIEQLAELLFEKYFEQVKDIL